VLIWSAARGLRYLMPVVPLYFFYIVDGFHRLVSAARPAWRKGFAVGAGAVVLATYAGAYAKRDFGSIAGGVRTPGFLALTAYINGHTQPADVFIFWNPRVLSLYTRRPAAVYSQTNDQQAHWRFFRSINARYIVVGGDYRGDVLYLQPFVDANRAGLEEVYSNAGFTLYRIR